MGAEEGVPSKREERSRLFDPEVTLCNRRNVNLQKLTKCFLSV